MPSWRDMIDLAIRIERGSLVVAWPNASTTGMQSAAMKLDVRMLDDVGRSSTNGGRIDEDQKSKFGSLIKYRCRYPTGEGP